MSRNKYCSGELSPAGSNIWMRIGELQSMNDLFSLKLALSFGLLGGLALIPLVLKKIKARQARNT